MQNSLTNYKISITNNSYDARLGRLMDILESDEQHSVDELGEMLGCGRRTIYRMLKVLQQGGKPIDYNKSHPRLKDGKRDEDTCSIFLSSEEVQLLMQTIHCLSMDNPFRQSLSSKFGATLRNTLMPYFTCNSNGMRCVAGINRSLLCHRQLVIKGYASSNSGTISDRLVEPVRWSANCRQLQAYDVEKGGMRVFAVSRMQETIVSDQEWQHEAQHRKLEEDCFWMTGDKIYNVTLLMDLRALNLLHEEYPLSEQYKVRNSGDETRPYKVTLEVRSPLGVERFVRGLSEHIAVEGTITLKKEHKIANQ